MKRYLLIAVGAFALVAGVGLARPAHAAVIGTVGGLNKSFGPGDTSVTIATTTITFNTPGLYTVTGIRFTVSQPGSNCGGLSFLAGTGTQMLINGVQRALPFSNGVTIGDNDYTFSTPFTLSGSSATFYHKTTGAANVSTWYAGNNTCQIDSVSLLTTSTSSPVIVINKPTNGATTTQDQAEPPPGFYVDYTAGSSSAITSSTPGIIEIQGRRTSPVSYATVRWASFAYTTDCGASSPGCSIPLRGQFLTDGTWELTAYLYDYADYSIYDRGAVLATSSVITINVGSGSGLPTPQSYSCAFNLPLAGQVDPCAWFIGLWMPSQASIDQFSSIDLSDKKPFSYFYTISTLWSSATSTSASAGQLTISYRLANNATTSVTMLSSSTIREYIPDSTWNLLQSMLVAAIWLGGLLYLYKRVTGHESGNSVLHQ